jgi:hypothetical protein
MAVLGVLFGVVLGVCALVLPFVANSAAKGAQTRTRAAFELVKQRGARVEALKQRTIQLRTALRKLLRTAEHVHDNLNAGR